EVQALRNSKTTTTQDPTRLQLTDLPTNSTDTTLWTFHYSVPLAPTPAEVALTRTTYKLPAAKAKALGEFLQQHVKASVMETKVKGESVIVTTTAEVQRGIGQFINLIEGKTPQGQGKTTLFENSFRPQAK